MAPLLTSVAIYRRRVGASLERVWENVFDWEHLPWLHAGSFQGIECLDEGDWGWRSRIRAQPDGAEIVVELIVARDRRRYVARTVEGNGAGTEIWTTLTPAGVAATDIEVDFQLPDVDRAHRDAIGDVMTRLYTRLWDEDEAMMRHRTGELARRAGPPTHAELDLGPEDALRAELPRVVDFGGRSWRVVEVDGELLVHSTTCPHMLGPLDGCDVEKGEIRCPWHGYRFDVRTRTCLTSPRLRLPPPPRAVVRDGGVRLVLG